jgi:3-dehydroquinate dehydratase-1
MDYICGCVNEKTKKEAMKSIETAYQEGAALVELRIDKLEEPNDAVAIIKSSKLPVIATCRRNPDIYGKEVKLLQDAIKAGVAYVDMDMETTSEEDYNKVAKTAKEKGCKVICSYHDYEKTPAKEELEALVEKMNKKADIVKIVTSAENHEDCERVLDLIRERTGGRIIAFCMGERYMQTRIHCVLCGAPWTYCKIKEETAPGQYSIDEAITAIERTKE